MKYPSIILLCCYFAPIGRTQVIEFDVDFTEKIWLTNPYVYNDRSLDLDFFDEIVYSYNEEGTLKEKPFKRDSGIEIEYKARTLFTENTLVDYNTDTRYVLFPEYYGLSNKVDQRISGCGSIMIEKLGTKGAEITHALFEDPDCDNFKKGAYFLSKIDSYIAANGDPVFLISMQEISQSAINLSKPEKGGQKNCVKRIILHRATNKVEVSVHLLNKVPAADEENVKANFIGSLDGKLYFTYIYTTPKTRLMNVDLWSVNETTLAESKEYSFQVDVPKGAWSSGLGGMEVTSDPASSGIACHVAFGVYEGKSYYTQYKVLEIHPGGDFKQTSFNIPNDILRYDYGAIPRLNYYDAGDATHFFMLTQRDMLAVSYWENDEDVDIHVERNVNFTSPSSAALLFDERVERLKDEYLKPIFDDPEAVCEGCQTYKSGVYRLTEDNQATFVAIEYLKACPACDAQYMRVRMLSQPLE